jgi:hypothetical protein
VKEHKCPQNHICPQCGFRHVDDEAGWPFWLTMLIITVVWVGSWIGFVRWALGH